jgi:DNA-binding IclR family transcriptional regulator
MPRSTVDTRIADLLDHGMLEKVTHGRYRVRKPS